MTNPYEPPPIPGKPVLSGHQLALVAVYRAAVTAGLTLSTAQQNALRSLRPLATDATVIAVIDQLAP